MAPVTTDIERAVEVLRRGGLVAFPTETVYGLGGDAANPEAVRRIFAAKGRPAGHPLIVHVARAEQLPEWTRLNGEAAAQVELLATAFWPGPLTMVLPRSDRVAPEAVGGHATIGLRVPDHPVATEILERFGGGIAAPSANRFGKVSPTTAAHVVDDLGDRVDLVVDGGPTRVGVESTIIEIGNAAPAMLRPGAVTIEQLSDALEREVLDGSAGRSRAAGMLASHYAPAAAVELVPLDELDGVLASANTGSVVGVIAPTRVAVELSWTLPDDAAGFAHELYAALRRADAAGVERLLIVPPSSGDMLDAVLDRLGKAAAPR